MPSRLSERLATWRTMSTSTETIEQLATREYKYGFVTDIEADTLPPGLDEDVIRALSAKKHEPEWMLEFRLKAYRAWLGMTEPTWHNVHYDRDRLPGHQLLLGAEEEAGAQQPRRGGPRAAQDLRQAGHPARRAEDPVRRRRRRRVRLGVGGDDLPRQAGREGHHLLLVQRGGAGPSRAGEEVPRLGRAVHGQLLCRAQLGRLQRRQLRLHPQGRALPDGAEHVLPHQRVEHRPVRAHADHRRGQAPS